MFPYIYSNTIYGHLHSFEKIKITKMGYIESIVAEISKVKYKEIEFSSA